MDDELTVDELFEYCNNQERATLNVLIAKHDAVWKTKPEKSKCSVCGKLFWSGSAMRAHKKAKDHYTFGDRLEGYYAEWFLKRLDKYLPVAELKASLAVELFNESDIIKFHRYEGEVNGQS